MSGMCFYVAKLFPVAWYWMSMHTDMSKTTYVSPVEHKHISPVGLTVGTAIATLFMCFTTFQSMSFAMSHAGFLFA